MNISFEVAGKIQCLECFSRGITMSKTLQGCGNSTGNAGRFYKSTFLI